MALPGLRADRGAPPAFDDLLGLLRAPPAIPPRDRWPAVLATAVEHRVAGLAATRLLESAGGLPAEEERALRSAADATRAMAAAVVATADRAGRLLAAERIPCLAIKGAGLIGSTYPSLSERTVSDLDLLVPRDRLLSAERALASLGFREATEPRSRAYFLRWHFHVPLRSPAGIGVDLHWDIVRPHEGFRPDLGAIFDRARAAAPTAAPAAPVVEDALLIQCLQHHQEGFASLCRTVDVDRLARRLDRRGWELVASSGRTAGMSALLWACLESSRRLVDTPVPAEILERVLPPGPVRAGIARLRPDLLIRRSAVARQPSIKWAVRFWTAPDGAHRLRVLRDLFLVEGGYWEDSLHVGRRQVPLPRRLVVRAGRLRTGLKLVAQQAWLAARSEPD